MNIIKETAYYINSGKIILYPTDTIWGLGCDLFNATAVNKIFKLKNRPAEKGFILLLNSLEDLNKYIVDIAVNIKYILQNFNNPTTIILDNPKNLPDYIVYNNSVAFRITASSFCKQLIDCLQKPLISTSANISGTKSPDNRLSSVSELIKSKVDYIALPEDTHGTSIPSSIVHIKKNGEFIVIRN